MPLMSWCLKIHGDIIGDISSKRGRVLGMEPGEDGITTVKARVPYAEMLDYGVQLRAMTQGRGNFDMAFDSYEEVSSQAGSGNHRQLQSRQRRRLIVSEK